MTLSEAGGEEAEMGHIL